MSRKKRKEFGMNETTMNVLVTILVLVLMFNMAQITMKRQNIPYEYCKSLGYEGYQDRVPNANTCYNIVNGFKEYSKEIPSINEIKELLRDDKT